MRRHPGLVAIPALLLTCLMLAGCSDADPVVPTPTASSGSIFPTQVVSPTPTPNPACIEPPESVLPINRGLNHAPDGRTGIACLDTFIEAMLTGTAADVKSRFPLFGTGGCPNLPATGSQLTDPLSARFADGPRSLHSASRSVQPGAEYVISFWVGEGERALAVTFALEDDRVLSVTAQCGVPIGDRAWMPSSSAGAYQQNLVLPPLASIPQPPRTHPLSIRTGFEDVDSILAAIEARDATRLKSYADKLTFRCVSQGTRALDACGPSGPPTIEAFFEFDCRTPRAFRPEPAIDWAIEPDVRLYSITRVPRGHLPESDYLVILLVPTGLYRSDLRGLLLKQGRIVATGPCGGQDRLYPPRYLVAPPTFGETFTGGSESSGVAMLDAILAAFRAKDVDALMALTDFTKAPCVAEANAMAPPALCGPTEAEGALVDTLYQRYCEAPALNRPQVRRYYDRYVARSAGHLFNVVADRGAPANAAGGRFTWRYEVFIKAVGSDFIFLASDRGIVTLVPGCGTAWFTALGLQSSSTDPEWLLAPVDPW